ncbi:MAG: HAMP domain-containing protein [Oscillatoriales cyanobacterium]|nr:MAG: HAMP domain-containing protein [Oscillatoriales cyanobacterium]TAH15621.1 MAG: HAMP domain-containing protein [Oscillatoriales cyanobacterium]
MPKPTTTFSKLHLSNQAIPKISLQTLLIVPFVLQIFAAVGLTGYLSFRNGQKAINELANRLSSEVSDRIDQHLDTYLATPQQINQINADAIKLGQLDLQNFPKVGHFFWKEMQVFNVGYIFYSSAQGNYVGSGYFLDPGKIAIDELSAKTKGKTHSYHTDGQGNRIHLEYVYDYEPRNDLVYKQAIRSRKPIWSKITNWEGFPEILSIASGYPIYNNKSLQGVLVVDIRLSQISDYLRKIAVSSSGKIFIVERDGMLVASSSQEHPFKITNKKAERINAVNSSDILIKSTATYLNKIFGSFREITENHNLQFTEKGRRQFVRTAPWQDEFGLDWLVVVVVPESDFTEQINANTRTTVLLCAGALLLAVYLGFWTSGHIVQSIFTIVTASEAIAAGKLDQKVPDSNVQELGILAGSFNCMAEQLRESFAALENTNEELEIRVKERTKELSQALYNLQTTQSQLVQTEKMSSLGQMVAGIAHEINNPVSFIHGNIICTKEYIQELLAIINLYEKYYPHPTDEIQQSLKNCDMDFLKEDLEKMLNSMQEGTNRIKDIVLNLRNFSRLDESQLKEVDLRSGLESTLLILQHRLKSSDKRPAIEVVKNYGNLPEVECYPGLLNQVFMNILSNAIDAIEELQTNRTNNKLTILISTEMTAKNCAIVRIRDNGFGIAENLLPKIFDPFFTTKPVGKGTGLGLSIAYQIVRDKHQGELICTSKLGEGTQFAIVLPQNIRCHKKD